MSILQAIILGIVQGLTEFIPVSSTAHLILVERVLGWNFDPDLNFAFNVLVQLGTTLALVIYFWRDLWGIVTSVIRGIAERKPFGSTDAVLGWLIVIATIPALIAGVLFKKQVETLQERPALIAAVLIVGSVLLFAGERIGRRTRPLTSVNVLDAIVIGLAQAVALIPGVSRSGATISGALARDLQRPAAARFSFLMSVPVLVGAGVLAFRDLLKVPNYGSLLQPLLVGFIVAGIVGFISIHWLLRYVAQRPVTGFGVYRVVAGVLFLVLLLVLGR